MQEGARERRAKGLRQRLGPVQPQDVVDTVAVGEPARDGEGGVLLFAPAFQRRPGRLARQVVGDEYYLAGVGGEFDAAGPLGREGGRHRDGRLAPGGKNPHRRERVLDTGAEHGPLRRGRVQ